MIRNALPVVRTAIRAARPKNARSMSGPAPAGWKTPTEVAQYTRTTLNDLPVPSGSWQKAYAAKNSQANMQLGVSLVVLAGTLYAMYATECFYLHSMPELKNK